MKIFIVMGLVVSFLCGCQVTPKKATYNTLAGVGAAVNNAADAVANARLQKKVSDNDWQQLKDVHNKFLLAYKEACTLAGTDFSKLAPAEIVRLELDFLNMVNLVLKEAK